MRGAILPMAGAPVTVFSFRRRPDEAKDAQPIHSDAPARQILDSVPPSPPAEVLQPAGSHHPAWLAATIGQSPGDRDARVKSLWTGKRLVGVFAYREQRWRWPWPQRVVIGWQSKLTFDGTPLIHRSHARTAIKTFIREQREARSCFRPFPPMAPSSPRSWAWRATQRRRLSSGCGSARR